MNLNQKLSDHFSLWECIRSETASRLGINNMPPEEYIPKLIIVCNEILEPPRKYFNTPFRPNSVYRCYEVNLDLYKDVKDIKLRKEKARTTQHYKAEAADFEIPGVSNYDLAVWLNNHIEIFDQLILECYKLGQPSSGWVHMSRRMKIEENRRRVMTFSKGQFISGLIR